MEDEYLKERCYHIINKNLGDTLIQKAYELREIKRRIKDVRKHMCSIRKATVLAFYCGKDSIKDDTVALDPCKPVHPAVKKLLSDLDKNTNSKKFSSQSNISDYNNDDASCDPSEGSDDIYSILNSDSEDDDDKMFLDFYTGNRQISDSSRDTDSISVSSAISGSVSEFYEKRVAEKSTSKGRARVLPKYTSYQPANVTIVGSKRFRNYREKRRIIIGNTSRYLLTPSSSDSESYTHEWMIYVRGPPESPSVDDIISKVVFTLHPSYAPDDIADISKSPFRLRRRGWGEFPATITLHFKHPLDKPAVIIHHLKLDKMQCGIEVTGGETHADVYLYTPISLATNNKSVENTLIVQKPTTTQVQHQPDLKSNGRTFQNSRKSGLSCGNENVRPSDTNSILEELKRDSESADSNNLYQRFIGKIFKRGNVVLRLNAIQCENDKIQLNCSVVTNCQKRANSNAVLEQPKKLKKLKHHIERGLEECGSSDSEQGAGEVCRMFV